jgi:hypothetical protein
MDHLEQLRAAGLGEGAIRWRVRVGLLHRLYRGVFAVGHVRLTWRGRLWAAVWACGGPDVAAASHRSAAAVWDLLATPSGAIDVTTARHRAPAAGIRIHRARSMPDFNLDADDGLPVTTVARTLIDLADVLDARRLERVCHRAEHLRLLDARAAPGRRTRKLGSAIATLAHDDPQLPRTPTAFAADRRRDVELSLAGYLVLRFTWRDVIHDAPRVVAAVAQVVMSRASSPKTST